MNANIKTRFFQNIKFDLKNLDYILKDNFCPCLLTGRKLFILLKKAVKSGQYISVYPLNVIKSLIFKAICNISLNCLTLVVKMQLVNAVIFLLFRYNIHKVKNKETLSRWNIISNNLKGAG